MLQGPHEKLGRKVPRPPRHSQPTLALFCRFRSVTRSFHLRSFQSWRRSGHVSTSTPVLPARVGRQRTPGLMAKTLGRSSAAAKVKFPKRLQVPQRRLKKSINSSDRRLMRQCRLPWPNASSSIVPLKAGSSNLKPASRSCEPRAKSSRVGSPRQGSAWIRLHWRWVPSRQLCKANSKSWGICKDRWQHKGR